MVTTGPGHPGPHSRRGPARWPQGTDLVRGAHLREPGWERGQGGATVRDNGGKGEEGVWELTRSLEGGAQTQLGHRAR